MKDAAQQQRMLRDLYEKLLRRYSPRGCWPLLDCEGSNPTKTGALQGYHPGDYSYPHDDSDRFEICVGAILTQNTSWPNVERALRALKDHQALSPEAILSLPHESLAAIIRPAGYYNQKARYLRGFARRYASSRTIPSREELLSLKGIGPETADSILLYAYGEPYFVVDAYTRRILLHHGLIDEHASYDEVQSLFHASLPREKWLYQEYHALLVEHAKRHYRKRPYDDPLRP